MQRAMGKLAHVATIAALGYEVGNNMNEKPAITQNQPTITQNHSEPQDNSHSIEILVGMIIIIILLIAFLVVAVHKKRIV